jgi:hypothetical protein
MQRVCVVLSYNAHAHDASHSHHCRLSNTDWPSQQAPCKADIAAGAAGCAGMAGTAEPKSLRGWQCLLTRLDTAKGLTITACLVGRWWSLEHPDTGTDDAGLLCWPDGILLVDGDKEGKYKAWQGS